MIFYTNHLNLSFFNKFSLLLLLFPFFYPTFLQKPLFYLLKKLFSSNNALKFNHLLISNHSLLYHIHPKHNSFLLQFFFFLPFYFQILNFTYPKGLHMVNFFLNLQFILLIVFPTKHYYFHYIRYFIVP